MTNETLEKRNYYKRFRTVGGYILVLAVITSALSAASSGLMLLVQMVFDNAFGELIYYALYYGIMLLSYYLAYRIFYKKYLDRPWENAKMDRHDLPGCLIVCLLSFVLMRTAWVLWGKVLNQFNYVETAGEEVSIVDIIYITLGAPIIEELVFRHWSMRVLKPYGPYVAIFISALTFGWFHGTFSQFIPAFIIGLVFGCITWHYKSVIPTIILHIANNTLSTFISIPENPALETAMLVISALFILVILVISFRRISWKRLAEPFRLIPHSISYIVFLIVYSLLIALEVLL
mgnify:CR=1 FL=1